MVCLMIFGVATILSACDDSQDKGGKENTTVAATNATTAKETSATTEKENADYELTLLSDGTYGVEKYVNTKATAAIVPATHGGKAVTQIMSDAFKGASGLTEIVIPDSIVKIAAGAFSGCSALSSLTLPFVGGSREDIKPIGYIFGTAAYQGASKVSQYSSVTSDGYSVPENFYIPSGLERVSVTDGVVKENAFGSCVMLKELILGDGVTNIQYGALSGCDNLEYISVGNGVTELAEESLAYLYGLKSVELGKNVRTIGVRAFYACESLESITIPYSVTTIERYAFSGCTALKSITFERTSGWYRDYGSASGTGMNVSEPATNAFNLTEEYNDDRWKTR